MGGNRARRLDMAPGGAPEHRAPVAGSRPLTEVVPPRAVLTELARGFLLLQQGDPERAKQFASSFLRERENRPGPGRIVPMNRRPTVRRGITGALRDPDEDYSESGGYASDSSNETGL
jgi:hypothetical protein